MRRPKRNRTITLVISAVDVKVRRPFAPAVRVVENKRVYSRKNARVKQEE
ncbi:MAG: hypothetical protein LBR82_01985 [Desulfovibrio sp.]|jgi:hypothetical protein|nr:hypothetical protein [Desulfovibrio sp.]